MRLTGSEEIARGTRAFYFQRPADFDFLAGQFVEVTLAEESPSDPVRSFSIASAPHESHLMIATRIRNSNFKQALTALPPGSEVEIEGPYGRFGLKPGTGLTHVLIAGGIGITPLRSMVLQATSEPQAEPVFLFHANRDVDGAPFWPEMTALNQREPAFTFVPTLTRPAEGWKGEAGYVDGAMLSRYVDPGTALFYISGPEAMVEAMKGVLASLNLPAERVLTEAFEGY